MGILGKLFGAGEPKCHHAVVNWKWEVEENDGQPKGPVWVDYYSDDTTLTKTVNWDKWSSRGGVEQFAEAHGYEFRGDE